jgi:hypothetical protein
MFLKDLPKNPRAGVCLYCPECLWTYSATRGDYFRAGSDEEAICGDCDAELVLVQKKTMLEPITPERAERKKGRDEEANDDDDGE